MLNSIEEHITILIYRFTYIYLPLKACCGRTFWSVLFRRSWCTAVWCTTAWCIAAWSFFSADFRFERRCFLLCGQIEKRTVLFACSEKGVCRQYRPSPLCTSCIYRLLASMSVLFQESSTLLYGLCCYLS